MGPSRTKKRARRLARGIAWTLALGAAACAVPVHAQAPLQNATPPLESIARIDAQECPVPNDPDLTRSNDGSGFLWPDRQTLVTAYHVVAGCGHVEVWFPDETVPVVARVSERSLPERDIALLDLPEPAEGYPLEFMGIHPPASYPLQLFGYAFGADVAAARQMSVASIARDRWPSLADILSTTAENEVHRTHGAINLDTSVIQVNGDISDGQSGAPIFDSAGYVVGIASGSVGAGGGTGQRVNWAIGSTHLNDIVQDSDILSRTAAEQGSLIDFAGGDGNSRPSRIQCGEFSFQFQESATLADLYARSDRPAVLPQALYYQLIDNADMEALDFDLWLDEVSGMLVATPRAAEFEDDPSGPCSLSIGAGISMRIFTYLAPDTGEIQRIQHFNTVISRFAMDVQDDFTETMAPDGSMYFYTGRESDGYHFVRQGFGHHEQTGVLGTAQSNYAVIGNHGRGRSLVAVAALHHDYTSDGVTYNGCFVDRNSERCVSFRRELMDWNKAFVAVHLATMLER